MKKIKLEQTIKLDENVVVSDPCYELEPKKWPQIILTNVKPGDYVIEVIDNKRQSGNRFTLTHIEDYSGSSSFADKLVNSVIMDTGQIGVFPIGEFRNDELIPDDYKFEFNIPFKNEGDKWYIAISTAYVYKVIKNCFTCNSGYGDGSANLYVDENEEGQVYRITVVF